jgi:predicted acylesterase/phospholipase RssA
VQDSTLRLVMTISGGGSRSSNFAKGVLLELENIRYHANSNVLREIDIFSTVSGGGHAAGAYIASLYEWNYHHDSAYSFNRFYRNEHNDLNFKYKTEPNGFYLLMQRFPANRARKLEKRVDDHVLLRKNTGSSILLGDLFVKKESHTKVLYPMLVANATNQQSKVRFPFTPDVLDGWQIKSYYHRKKYVTSKSMDQLPLAAALTASGTVPLMVPPAVFQDSAGRYIRFVDGGLADNTGVATAMRLITRNFDHEPRKKRRKLLIVDDTPGGVEDSYAKRLGHNRYQAGDLIWYGLDSKYFTFYQDLKIYTYYNNNHSMDIMDSKDNIDYNILDFRVLLYEPETESKYLAVSKIKTVFDNDKTIPDKLDKDKVTDQLLRNYEYVPDVIPPLRDRKLLFEMVTHVDTKYEATDRERRILILAGRVVVRMQKKNILSLLE